MRDHSIATLVYFIEHGWWIEIMLGLGGDFHVKAQTSQASQAHKSASSPPDFQSKQLSSLIARNHLGINISYLFFLKSRNIISNMISFKIKDFGKVYWISDLDAPRRDPTLSPMEHLQSSGFDFSSISMSSLCGNPRHHPCLAPMPPTWTTLRSRPSYCRCPRSRSGSLAQDLGIQRCC